ncbi:MAG: SlyX family protein [Thermodesulfobacteriota bacterium]
MTAESETLTARIIELETRLAFQDHTIEELDGVIISQQQQLDRLEADLALLKRQLQKIIGGSDDLQGGHGC